MTSPDSASLKLQLCHLSLSYPSSLAFLIFHSISPSLVSSHYLLWLCPPPLLIIYRTSIHHHFFLSCLVSSVLVFLFSSHGLLLSNSLSISFFLFSHFPCFLTIITAQFSVHIRAQQKKKCLEAALCVYLLLLCVSFTLIEKTLQCSSTQKRKCWTDCTLP